MGDKIKNNITPASILLTIHTCNIFYPIEALHLKTLRESKKSLIKEKNISFIHKIILFINLVNIRIHYKYGRYLRFWFLDA